MISDKEVFGMVVHYVHDEKIEVSDKDHYVLTREEKKSLEEKAKEDYLAEQKRKLEEKERKEEEKRKKAIEKEKKAREESGQISLFDDLDWGN